jgi:SAM-dependent methyltransferase
VSFDDPKLVAREYESEERFVARRVVFSDLVQGETAEDLAIEALREVDAERVLEVGCGLGDFAQRAEQELGASLLVVDASPRMVELAQGRGLDAQVADVQALPFRDEQFDAVVANWVLHHVPDRDRGIAEIARVLRPGGTLVAATFSNKHLLELYQWLGDPSVGELEFARENGTEPLSRHFGLVERRDAEGTVVFPNRGSLQAYLASLIRGAELVDRLPSFEGEYRARSSQSIFVAKKA